MKNYIFVFSFILYLGVCIVITNDKTAIIWLVAGYYVIGGLFAIANGKFTLLSKFIKLGVVMAWIGIMIMLLQLFFMNIFDTFPAHLMMTVIIYIVLTEMGEGLILDKNSALCDNPDYHSDKPN